MLAEIALLNKAIMDQKKFTISISGNRKGLMIDQAYNEKVVAILKAQRSKRIKDINTKAQKFRIGLSEEDKQLMEDPSKESENPSESIGSQVEDEDEVEAPVLVAEDAEFENMGMSSD